MLNLVFADPSLALTLILPGLVAYFMFSRLVPWTSRTRTHVLMRFAALALIYFGLVEVAVALIDPAFLATGEPRMWELMLWLLGGAVLLGIGAAVIAQKDLFGRLAMRLPLVPRSHHLPTAWDWKFQNLVEETWIVVTLTDRTIFHGFCSWKSFVSADPGERDIFIEKVYDVDKNGTWKERDGKGVLIKGASIQSIEFIPSTPE